ncbi:MAG: CBS domain-containing protein [Beijerinckiaceae bacterium]
MNVAHILASKGRDVISAMPDHTLQDAARLMAERGIGALVVCNREKQIAGILSERDIMRAIARNGPGALDDRVSSHMTTKVRTCGEGTTIQALMEEMTLGRFRHIPVVQDGALCGMISIGDLIKNRLVEMEREQEDLKNYIATA